MRRCRKHEWHYKRKVLIPHGMLNDLPGALYVCGRCQKERRVRHIRNFEKTNNVVVGV